MGFDVLEWQQGERSVMIRLADSYLLDWKMICNYPEGRTDLINGAMFNYFNKNNWKPLSMTSKTVGFLWWKQEINVWVFTRER
jgi:hypothetical protein